MMKWLSKASGDRCSWSKTGTRTWSAFAEIHSIHRHWKFQLEFVTHTSQQTRDLCDLWLRSLDTPGLPITSGTLSACRSFSWSESWLNFSHCFHMISFCSRVYIYAHGMRYLHHDVHELDRYNHEFWKTGKFFEMCSRVSRLGSPERLRRLRFSVALLGCEHINKLNRS